MRLVLDTNILLFLLKNGGENGVISALKTHYPLFPEGYDVFLSVVSLGELYALGKMNKWGSARNTILRELCSQFLIADINSEDVLQKYAEIDAFSQGRLGQTAFSARNMGKNDLWIAATAAVLEAVLLTTDKDFEHLDGTYLDLLYIDPKTR